MVKNKQAFDYQPVKDMEQKNRAQLLKKVRKSIKELNISPDELKIAA